MSLAEAAALAAAAFFAGAINAVAGGGTILTFPALLAWGMPAIAANATSTFALVAGTAGSTLAYRGQIASVRGFLPAFGTVSVAG
ncbi:MAG: TSUP family transporter, partial [Terrimicrobiaceae bacterium]|nr:TSUP family transporter [Terrimicrobiaceae bacterium]